MDAETQTPYDDSPACTATIQIHMDHHGPAGHSHPSCTCAWICLLPTFTLVPQIIQFSIENRVEFENTVNQQLAYFEPALKSWLHLHNFCQVACVPLQHTNSDHLSALETACQTTYRPQYKWPWINSLLTKFHIGKQRFGPLFTKPFLDRSRKFGRRYQKRTPTEQMCFLGNRLHTSKAIYKLLTRLGSDTIEKIHVSQILRSTQTDVTCLFLLWPLSHHPGELFVPEVNPNFG